MPIDPPTESDLQEAEDARDLEAIKRAVKLSGVPALIRVFPGQRLKYVPLVPVTRQAQAEQIAAYFRAVLRGQEAEPPRMVTSVPAKPQEASKGEGAPEGEGGERSPQEGNGADGGNVAEAAGDGETRAEVQP